MFDLQSDMIQFIAKLQNLLSFYIFILLARVYECRHSKFNMEVDCDSYLLTDNNTQKR